MPFAPRLTIALPVYNGQRYLAEAIDSVLEQTFGDFELLITDNASTDDTEPICRAYAAQDPRVRYVRNAQNIGAVRNFNLGFELCRAEYFRWHAYDDLMAPRCVEACVAALDADHSLAVSQSLTELIDEHGNAIEMFATEQRLDSPHAHERFRGMLWARSFPPIFGVMRSSLVRRTGLFGPYVGADRYFLAELLLLGGLAYVRECLFSIRIHPDAYRVRGATDLKTQRAHYTPGRGDGWRGASFMQMPMTAWAFAQTLVRSRAPLHERIKAMIHVAHWFGHGSKQIVERRLLKRGGGGAPAPLAAGAA